MTSKGVPAIEIRYIARSEGKLLRFLRRELGFSSSLVSRLKFRGAFFVNGEAAHTDRMVVPGDEIRVVLDEPAPDYPAEDGPLEILYEDEAIIALDKPPGLIMHPTFHRTTGTLANRVLAHYRASGQACAVHPVSRLDRDTFGVVLLAKNAHVHALLNRAPKEKVYEALVLGVPEPPMGIIDAPIARLSPTSLLRCVREAGKQAVTKYETIWTRETGDGSLSAEDREPSSVSALSVVEAIPIRDCADRKPSPVSLVRLWPLTGRTHQLRVHLAHIGCPILGDPQYGTPLAITQQLCARRLRITHPFTGEAMEFTSRQSLAEP